MESHVLNSYHQARYRTIGHKIMREKSDSLSSEGSTQNSPEYAQIALQRVPSVAQSEDSNGEEWCQSQTINTTQSNQDTSSDEESSDGQDETEENLVIKEDKTDDEEDIDDNLVVQEINVDDSDENIDVDDNIVQEVNIPVRQNGFHNARDSNLEDNSLVEGHDYDVITVYEVNPDLDLIEASSDDDSSQTDFAVTEKDENYDEGEYVNAEDSINYNNSTSYGPQPAPENGIDLNVDTPVVLNVDEYFIEEKDILHVDGPVVKDVDEYFIKDKGKKKGDFTSVPNVDDFFIKHTLPEEESTEFHIPETLPNVDEFLVIENNIKKEEPKMVVHTKVIPEEYTQQKVIPEVEPESKLDVSINESDLDVLPNIEDLKRYLLEEMTYSKFKSIQRSCSLPHSPLHRPSVCMDIEDSKTCLSFEDLNLDLSDLTFESDKDKSENVNKSDDIPRTLTDEDVNSFLITNKPEAKTKKDEDDLSPQEMEIEDTIESNITDIPPVDDSFRKLTSTPLPSIMPTSKVLDFCVEKTPSPSRKVLNRKEKVAALDSQATPRKVVVELPRKAKIVSLNSQLNPTKVIDVIPEVPVVKPIPVVAKSTIPVKPVAIKAVTPKPIATKIAESKVAPVDLDDFVDVESCNDAVIPVLEANNLSSLLEQFEATEKLNKSKKPLRIVPVEEQKKLNKSLTNGVRIQDAGVQLKNNKMRQILMPTTIKTAVRRTPSPVHSDHDYCSSKKRHSLPNLKGGQSLLKPEVLSSNSRILSSRHRTCKNKKVVYNLSSDEESDKKDTKNKKNTSDSESKKKISITVKPPAQSNCRKKLSPSHSVNDVVLKSNSSVINKCASKASDTPCSQNSNGSIRLTIKNKSEVILNCDHKDSQIKHNVSVEKLKVSSSVSDVPNVVNVIKQEKHIKVEEKHIKMDEKQVKVEEKHVKLKEKHIKDVEKNIKEVVRIKNKNVHSIEDDNIVRLKEETRPKDENFYTALFSNKHDVKIPQTVPIKKEINAFEEELNKANDIKKEEPLKKKKLNLQEYKLRRGVSSNNSSTAVSPESIFPDILHPLNSDKTAKPLILTLPNDIINKPNNETTKKFYDPIREASRKIVANAKKLKAEALRKRDEDIVMSKIPKVDNLQLQPLISDAEMLKIVGMTQPEPEPAPAKEKPADYDEIILVSVGTNTDDKLFKKLLEADLKMIEKFKSRTENSLTPPIDPKSRINFKINKSENVLKQNVFDLKKDKRHEDKKHTETKIDKERFKDITATLKSVGKQVDTKISSNSLFASIQDVVMKKAPEDEEHDKDILSKPKSPAEKCEIFKFGKATIVREYDMKADHGEDKIILHLGKQRSKPISANITVQTEPVSEDTEVSKAKTIAKEKSSVNRRRNDSDMSMSSEGSPVRVKEKSTENKIEKPKADTRPEKRSLSKEKRSRSKDRYEAKYRRRSRSLSRSRRRRRSPTRSRSRSRGRFRRYRRSDRSDSPYKRKRRSRSRTYHKRRSTPRRSPSIKINRSRSRSRSRSKSPVAKKAKPSPQSVERKPVKSMTPPLRKPTVSESSDSSTSSSSSSSTSSSSSSSSASSGKSRSCSLYKQEPFKKGYRSFSSEDRENNTPVEERRIVFVGKLEKDITKSTLRSQFTKFGHVIEVRLHSKEDGTRYGFVTYQRPRDAWSAVEAASTFPQYDVGFGGRRAFCRQSYADLDGLEAKFTESAFHGSTAPLPVRRTDDMSFEQMLLEMKKKLSQRKNDPKRDVDP